MLDNSKPFIEEVPNEELADQMYQYNYQSHIENIPSQLVLSQVSNQTDSNGNILAQQAISKSVPIISNESPVSYEEDILKKSSLNEFDDINDNPYVNTNEINNDPSIAKSIPQIGNDQYNLNNINENQQLYNSTPIPTVNNIYSSEISPNVNNVYESIQPINNYQITSEIIPQYDQNIIYSTQNPVTTNIINDFPESSSVVTAYPNQSASTFTTFNPNRINNYSHSPVEVVTIDDELMKNNPEVAKYVIESQRHVDNYLAKFENNSNLNNYNNNLKNSKLNKNRKNNYNFKLKNSSINPNNFKDLKGIKNFSQDFWRNFYDENTEFFQPAPRKDIIPNQVINNPYKNEIYYGDVNELGKKHGFGKLVTPKMERIGEWKNDQFIGWGREVLKTGEIYEGKFTGNAINGKGIYKDGNLLYIGNFNNNIKNGKGELFCDDFHYVGNFRNNSIHGKGRIELYDNGVYEGSFVDGEITGYGIFKYFNGDYYEGEMRNGKKHGFGKLTKHNGNIYEGKFNNDVFQDENNFSGLRKYKLKYSK